ncbi:MAG TPA: hypothetical protein VKB43_11255 [Gaiellaceae bacterium]|nr:hypothetical protein [Gaiellaceae bacterium]
MPVTSASSWTRQLNAEELQLITSGFGDVQRPRVWVGHKPLKLEQAAKECTSERPSDVRTLLGPIETAASRIPSSHADTEAGEDPGTELGHRVNTVVTVARQKAAALERV